MNNEHADNPTKILQIAQEPTTIYIFLKNLIKELKNQGYQVEVACKAPDYTRSKYRGHSSTRMTHEAEELSPWHTEDQEDIEDNYFHKLQKEGIKTNPIFIKRSLNPIYALRTFIDLFKLMKKNNYDLVVTHTPIISFNARYAAYFAKVPKIIYTAHGLPFTKDNKNFRERIFYLLEKFAGKITDCLICINDEDYQAAIKKRLVKKGIIRKINGIGIDAEKYKKDPIKKQQALLELNKLNVDITNKKVIIFIGRLIETKGIKEYLMAANELIRQHEDLIFLILGKGELQEYTESYIESNNLEQNVKCLSFRDDIDVILQIADIFVLPTYYPEGMPRTILEAMSIGVPVIASNIRGCRELVVDNQTGLIIQPRQVSEIVKAANVILSDYKHASYMAENAKLNVIENYCIKKVIKKQIDIYKEVLA